MLASPRRAMLAVVIFRFDDYELDEDAGELRRSGVRVEIQPKPFELLRLLVRERARVVPADELMSALWPGIAVTPSSLTRAVSHARRAIGDTHTGERIQSAARRGYRFAGEVREGPAPAAVIAQADERTFTAFVGREEALAELRAAFEAARAGRVGSSPAAQIGRRAWSRRSRAMQTRWGARQRAAAIARARRRSDVDPAGRRLMAETPCAGRTEEAPKRADEMGLFGRSARPDVAGAGAFLFFEAAADCASRCARAPAGIARRCPVAANDR
jgi:DNA-binding winged helix-turn-helix (wHTH) protein